MPQYIDSYYLVHTRKLNIIYDFFTKYFPLGLRELATDYPFPEFSDYPEKIYIFLKDLLIYLEKNPVFEYTVYFENKDKFAIIKQVTLQYTNDGKIIFGVSIIGNEPSLIQKFEVIKDIKHYLDSNKAYATVEEAPPGNSEEFINFYNKRYKI